MEVMRVTMVACGSALTAAPHARTSPRWGIAGRALVVAAAYMLTYVAVFSQVLFRGEQLAPGDGTMIFLTGFRSARWAWDPTMFAGFPGLADPQRMSWYPPALAAAMLPDGWNALVLSAYVLSSCFAYAYVRGLTGSSLGAAVAGLVYGLSGFLIAHLGHINLVHASAWLPMVLYAFENLRQRVTAVWLAVAALSIASSLLAGHSQISAYTLLYLGPYVLVAAANAPVGRARYCAAAAAAVALGLAISAISLLPLHQLTKGSLRTDVDYAMFTSFNLPLEQLPQLLFPYAYGDVRWLPYIGAGNITETTGYVGFLPLLLAGLGACSAIDRRAARFWLAAGACALLLSLGPDGGLAPLAYHIPAINKFRCPARHLGEFSLAVAVLSGFGAASLATLPRRRRLRLAMVASLAVIVVAGGACLALSRWAGFQPETSTHISWQVSTIGLPSVALLLGLTMFWLNVLRPTKLAGGLLVLAIALELGVLAQQADWSWASPEEVELDCPPVLAKYREEFTASGQRLTGLLSAPRTPADAALANLPALWKLPATNGFHPLVPRRLVELLTLDHLGQGFESYHALSEENRALGLLASRYVVAPQSLIDATCPSHDAEAKRLLTGSARFRLADILAESVSFENTRALPRAWLVNEARPLDQGAVLRAIHTSRLPDGSPFDPTRTALVEDAYTFRASHADGRGTVGTRELAPGNVQIETESPDSTFCVVSDMYYPGWQATIDGQPARILRADYVLMGVEVPPGRHVVRFRYGPTRFYVGAAITGCSLLIVLACLARSMTVGSETVTPT